MKTENVEYPEGGHRVLAEQGMEFVEALDKLVPDSDNLTPYELVDALGLSRQGLTAAQTISSIAIARAFEKGEDGHPGMKSLFTLGTLLGIAYARATEGGNKVKGKSWDGHDWNCAGRIHSNPKLKEQNCNCGKAKKESDEKTGITDNYSN